MEKLGAIRVRVVYDENLKKITKKDFDEPVVSENLSFPMFLNFIFTSYPKITKEYPPGKLGFLLNNSIPQDFDILEDGDEIKIIGV